MNLLQTDGVWHRPGGDQRVIREVLHGNCYRRVRDNFYVEAGESWLDLGAHIGCFAVYCRRRGAAVECWEPVQYNYEVLLRNIGGYKTHCSVVSSSPETWLPFYDNINPDDHSRGTLLPGVAKFRGAGTVRNYWAGYLRDKVYDGVKVDIEGAEGPLIDEWLFPRCRKLVLEYSTSRDHSAENLGRRLEILKSKFNHVVYPPEYDRAVTRGGRIGTHPYHDTIIRFDRLVFAWGPR